MAKGIRHAQQSSHTVVDVTGYFESAARRPALDGALQQPALSVVGECRYRGGCIDYTLPSSSTARCGQCDSSVLRTRAELPAYVIAVVDSSREAERRLCGGARDPGRELAKCWGTC